jgi:hypothetical protein
MVFIGEFPFPAGQARWSPGTGTAAPALLRSAGARSAGGQTLFGHLPHRGLIHCVQEISEVMTSHV